MADKKKNIIKEKLSQHVEGDPQNSDWAAMNSMIDAHPALNKKKRNGAAFKFVISAVALLFLISAGAAMYLYYDFDQEKDNQIAETENTDARTESKSENEKSNDRESNDVLNDGGENDNSKTLNQQDTEEDNQKTDETKAETNKEKDVQQSEPDKNNKNTVKTGSDQHAEQSDERKAPAGSKDKQQKTQLAKKTDNSKRTPGKTENNASSAVEQDHTDTESNNSIAENRVQSPEKSEKTEVEADQTETDDRKSDVSDDKTELTKMSSKRFEPVNEFAVDKTIIEEQKTLMVVEEPVVIRKKKMNSVLNNTELTAESDAVSQPDTSLRNEYLKSSRIKMSNLNAGIHYTAVPDDQLFGYGGGMDIDIQKGNFLLNTGVYFTQFNNKHSYLHSRVDTQTTIETEEHREMNVDSSWVLTGPNQGHYEYDTSFVTRQDTVVKSSLDTVNEERSRTSRLSYIEVPVAVGYRFHMGRWGVDLYGGVVVHQLISKQYPANAEHTAEIKREFGTDLMFQPELRYLFSANHGVFVRSSLRYPLTPSASIREQRMYGNIQLGLSFMW